MSLPNTQRGIIKEIVIIVVAVLALNYIGFDVKEFLNSPEVKNGFQVAWDFLNTTWINYIEEPALYVWNTLVIGVVWEQWLNPLMGK